MKEFLSMIPFLQLNSKKILGVVPFRMKSNNIPLSWLFENIPLCENVAKDVRV